MGFLPIHTQHSFRSDVFVDVPDEISMEILRGTGPQAHEELLPEEDASAAAAGQSLPPPLIQSPYTHTQHIHIHICIHIHYTHVHIRIHTHPQHIYSHTPSSATYNPHPALLITHPNYLSPQPQTCTNLLVHLPNTASAPALNINQAFVQQLMDMGFPKNRCEKAVHNTKVTHTPPHTFLFSSFSLAVQSYFGLSFPSSLHLYSHLHSRSHSLLLSPSLYTHSLRMRAQMQP